MRHTHTRARGFKRRKQDVVIIAEHSNQSVSVGPSKCTEQPPPAHFGLFWAIIVYSGNKMVSMVHVSGISQAK